MSQEAPAVQIPSGQMTITVKLINLAHFGPAIIPKFMEPPVPGTETLGTSPSFSFLLEHPSGRKLVFDLGIRKDYTNYSPVSALSLKTVFANMLVTKNVADILEESGVATRDIESIIWSHWHWDHCGDPSTFPTTTDLVVGPRFKEAMLPGAPANPESPILETDYAGRNLREISFGGPDSLHIGQFPAFDYFGDGSFYLLDTPGHCVSHISGLVRTTTSPDTFVLLGGDACYYAGVLRPSKYMPVPETIAPHPDSNTPLCTGKAFEHLQKSRGREATDTLYDLTYAEDVPLARQTVKHLQELDCNENIFIIMAHDSAVRDGVAHFPDSLNAWKEKGWDHGLRWSFLRDLERD